MRRKKIVISISVLLLWTVAIAAFYLLREDSKVKDFTAWALSSWPILTAWYLAGAALITWIWKRNQVKEELSIQDRGLVLLNLLDTIYLRLKEITKNTIRQQRKREWSDINVLATDLMWLTDMDIQLAIERIMLENVYKFVAGQPMTVERDGKRLANKIKKSPLFTRNPEDIAKDASVILKEKVPYLKRKLEHDFVYKNLQRRIERERDKLASEAVSDAINAYLDHSIKINAAWIMSARDLDGMGEIEYFAGRQLPMKFKVILMGLPGRMDEEMSKLRTKVAVAIMNDLKGVKQYELRKGETNPAS